jgi:phosphoglycerate dehydrogenase-like enzyme
MMAKPKILVAGLGEIGSAVYQVAREFGRFEVYGYARWCACGLPVSEGGRGAEVCS